MGHKMYSYIVYAIFQKKHTNQKKKMRFFAIFFAFFKKIVHKTQKTL